MAITQTDYVTARDAFLAEGAKFREAQSAYQSREIGDDAFLAARASYLQAHKDYDVAEEEFFGSDNADAA